MTLKVAGLNAASGLILGSVFAFFLAGAVFCKATLQVPRKLGPTPSNATVVTTEGDDQARLSAWWFPPVRPDRNCVLVLHGIGDSRVGSVGYAPMFRNEGYGVLLPDSRAHGASEGRFVTYGLLEKYDTIHWADWMKQTGCNRLYALGESLGASILIEAAALKPAFAAIVAECPYADLHEIAEYRVRQILGLTPLSAPIAKAVVSSAVLYARWVDGLELDQVSPLRVIGRTATPILLIHGLRDERTPPSNSERLAKANPRNALWLVPNAVHTGAADAEPDKFRRRVLDWFTRH